MQRNKAILYGSVFIIAMQAHSCTYAMDPVGEAINLTYEATKKAGGDILQSVAGAGACVKLAINVYTIGKDVASYVCPSEQRMADVRAIEKEIEVMALKKELRECLIKNRIGAQMGPIGAPVVCEDLIIMLSTRGKADVADKMMAVFNKVSKK